LVVLPAWTEEEEEEEEEEDEAGAAWAEEGAAEEVNEPTPRLRPSAKILVKPHCDILFIRKRSAQSGQNPSGNALIGRP